MAIRRKLAGLTLLTSKGIPMKRSLFAAALAAAIAIPAFAAPQTYVLDPTHSFPRFSYDHMGFSKQILRFNETTGEVVLDRDAKKASVNVTIDMNSIDTGVDAFDKHMKSDEIFDTARFPTATFRSTKVTFAGDRPATITGDLTIKGITKPVTLTVNSFSSKAHPMLKKDAIGANATGVIRRSEFNAGYGVPAIGDEVRLDIALEAVTK
jgi:polyisoprenoid-binding protein YceI